MWPKVSVIIPTHNRAHYLPETLDSVLMQTYPNIEVIVVNDGSIDHTDQVLVRYMKYIDHYIKKKNGGCASAKNTGLLRANGELITNVDDDDRIHPEKIQLQVEMFSENPHIGLCATGANFINGSGQVTGEYIPPHLSKTNQIIELLRRCSLIQSSVMIHRRCHRHLGNYKLTHAQDYDFWLRAAVHYEIAVIEEALTEYRHHGDQITGPHNRRAVRAAVTRIKRHFVERVPVERIIPGLRHYPPAYAALGLVLCEQLPFETAETYLTRALPHAAGHFGLFLLRLHEKKYHEARTHIEQIQVSDSPLGSKVEEALMLMERAQAIVQKPGVYHNTSPEVVRLRNDLSRFHTVVLRRLLHLARSGDRHIDESSSVSHVPAVESSTLGIYLTH